MSDIKKPLLCLHAGAEEVTIERLQTVSTSLPTKSWTPIPHHSVLELARSSLLSMGMEVRSEQHALSKDGARYFGILDLTQSNQESDWCMLLGVRNSHDMTFPASRALGQRVFVCDNLAFSAEVTLKRKHTTYIMRDLPALVSRAISQLSTQRGRVAHRVDAYKGMPLSVNEADHYIVDTAMHNIVPGSVIGNVAREWRKPTYEDFRPCNVWSLYNAFTTVLGKQHTAEYPRRTMALTGFFDGVVGLN